MRGFVISAMVIAVAMLGGCAGLTVKPVVDDDKDRGFRYYGSSPFLLIYTDNKGGLESKLLYLGDTSKKMSVRPYNYLASNKTTLTFDKGRLTQAKAAVDETVIPSAVVSSLEKVATALIKAANSPSTAGQLNVPAPYLFRIIKSGGKWTLAGGQGMDDAGDPAPIRVTVVN